MSHLKNPPVVDLVGSKYYDLLEVPPNASESDLKKAYRKKCVKVLVNNLDG
jgi:hypothetical protein